MKTLNLNIEQIKTIFNAGVRRGEAEQCAADWGCKAQGRQEDELIEALVDTGLINWDTAELWIREK